MDVFGIPMEMMIDLELPDSTQVVYIEADVDNNTIGAVRTKNWRALYAGFKNARGTIELVWCPNDDPNYHSFYVPRHPDAREPKKVYGYQLFSTSFKDSLYRYPRTLGEYKAGAALIMEVERIHGTAQKQGSTPDEEWKAFQALLQTALKRVTEWGEQQP